MSKEQLEKIYQKRHAVWTLKNTPSRELRSIVSCEVVNPCRAIDLGCGEGYNSIYLALNGFDVTGVDISENAIAYAKENAGEHGVNIDFRSIDLLDNLDELGKFGFGFEWALLSQIMPEERKRYMKNLAKIIKEDGFYFSYSFNIKSEGFGGSKKGKYRTEGATGLPVYCPPTEETRELIESTDFKIKMVGKDIKFRDNNGVIHNGNYFLSKRTR
ncbi:MAG TPA: class I SAM-dependent methyltransferase [Candidatus Pacearchaeota archaeon]|nr:putative S-adenosyl-L-methionine-dependent methyltransferase TehB [archaeon BMS3Abin17]HDK42099.1 class I SAM-dependent methyltransferase [Candidatus Pacearchaeota archaeon]HDZ61005.1 class I SAM-dependent methyltransferase [Candidatus Pacearchaeota archaeon]